MNERLVEDWLAKANERAYQLPFAQSLLSEGVRVLRVGHGPHEHGKDVIALDKTGGVHAYQLKDGDLDLKQFEAGFPQLVALVETQVEHPSIPGHPNHQPWLVISGKASMPVEDRIRAHNITWEKRGYRPLRTINGSELQHRFATMAENFWPQMPEDSRRLFNLYLADGIATLDRQAFAQLLESTTLNRGNSPKTEMARRLSAANLFASYALSPFYSTKNYWELVQGWTLAAAQIAYTAIHARLQPKVWRATFRLAVEEALLSLENLVNEALEPHAFDPRGFELDELTRSRCTICAGAIAAKVLLSIHSGVDWERRQYAKATLERLFVDGRLIIWGESAVPFFLMMVWALDNLRGDQFSDMILLKILSAIVRQNSQLSAAKLPLPYDSADEANAKALRHLFEDEKALETQAAASYTLESLVLAAARRLWRNTLAATWSPITKTDLVRLVPDKPEDLLLWHWGHDRGSNQTRLFPAPQSWGELLTESRRDERSSLPDTLKQEFDFSLLFVLCFPHRLTTALVKHMEDQTRNL